MVSSTIFYFRLAGTIMMAFAVLLLLSCHNPEKSIKEPPAYSQELIDSATKIHKDVLTIDTHIDINVKNFTDSINYSQELSTQVNLPKMKKGGLDVAWLIVYTGQKELTEEGYEKAYDNAISKFNAIHKLTSEIAPEHIALATSSQEVKQIAKSGKKVAMIGVENGFPIGTDVNRVKEFYDLGARYMSLAHNGHSQLSDSNTGENDNVWLHNGLSDLGKEVLVEMNKWGMMIDVSHPSKEAIRDMAELSEAPLMASHSSARALCDHSRNLDDEQLEWIKNSGGVVQTVAFKSYLNEEQNQRYNKMRQKILQDQMKSENFTLLKRSEIEELSEEDQNRYHQKNKDIREKTRLRILEESRTTRPVGITDFVDHIDYLVDKIGIDHVGISSDFDGGGGIDGWKDASETLNVTIELVARGYSKDDISKLWGENLLRVLDKVQEVAQEIQAKQ
jgi:microsomal dipeptidase-like Zn-dependent dipeptidase